MTIKGNPGTEKECGVTRLWPKLYFFTICLDLFITLRLQVLTTIAENGNYYVVTKLRTDHRTLPSLGVGGLSDSKYEKLIGTRAPISLIPYMYVGTKDLFRENILVISVLVSTTLLQL